MAGSFERFGLIDILVDFDATIASLHEGSRIPFLLADHDAACITETEAMLLALWCDAARDPCSAREVLRYLVEPAWIEGILIHLVVIAGHMASADLAPVGRLERAT
jgi:hypothetical protein